MKEFILLFRRDITAGAGITPEQEKKYNALWGEWIGDIAAVGKLGHGGHDLLPTGKVVKHGGIVVDSAYNAGRKLVTGYVIIHANDLEDAAKIAGRCPLLEGEATNIEVREVK